MLKRMMPDLRILQNRGSHDFYKRRDQKLPWLITCDVGRQFRKPPNWGVYIELQHIKFLLSF